MVIARSFWRQVLVTVLAAAAFMSVYDITIHDSQDADREATVLAAPGAQVAFNATAYCKGETTASGVAATSGVVAADPELLPVGSVVSIQHLEPRYDGIYTVLDTGPSVQGRLIDIYIWSCNEALQFGRRSAHLAVLRLGWDPKATTPGLLQGLFKRPESQGRVRLAAPETD